MSFTAKAISIKSIIEINTYVLYQNVQKLRAVLTYVPSYATFTFSKFCTQFGEHAWDKIIFGTCIKWIYYDATLLTTMADSLHYVHLVSEQFMLRLQYGISVSSKAMSFTIRSFQVVFLTMVELDQILNCLKFKPVFPVLSRSFRFYSDCITLL